MKINPKAVFKYIKRSKLIFFIFAILVLVSGVLIYFVNRKSSSCAAVNAQTNKIFFDHGRTRDGYQEAYKKLQTSDDTCISNSSAAIGNSQGAKVEYYFNKAVVEYRLGKNVEAQANADKAIAVYEKLTKNEKKTDKMTRIRQQLTNIKENVY